MLVKLGLAKSRTQASEMIKEGQVLYQGQKVTKSSKQVLMENIEVLEVKRYVGRGAHKLAGAITYFDIKIKDLVIADVGASTGGFTDYSLQNGVKKVYALDVGHGQLSSSLLLNSKVENFEGINIRYGFKLPELVDAAFVDLSFISLKLTLKPIFNLVKDNGKIIVLVKPQFEIGKRKLGKNGVIKDHRLHLEVLADLFDFCQTNHMYIRKIHKTVITGGDGNQEFFFYFKKGAQSSDITIEDLKKLTQG